MPLNKHAGLMEPPLYPCIKAEGLCDLRTIDTTHFECGVENPKFVVTAMPSRK